MDLPKKLKALSVQVIEREDGIILKRGCTEFRIDGPEAKPIARQVFGALDDKGATAEEICALFPAPYQSSIRNLVEQLTARRILVPIGDSEDTNKGAEDGLEIFYWNFGFEAQEVTQRLNSRRIVIVGVNYISRQLVTALSASGVTNVQVIDYPLLRNVRMFDGDSKLVDDQWPPTHPPIVYKDWADEQNTEPLHCVVATSDFGGAHLMREWNRYCVEENHNFLPVVLQHLIGYVGPLVVPGETACYECLRARQNSHLEDPETSRAAEHHAFQGQLVNGFHPSMASILGDISAIELTKFYGRVPRWRVGALVEVNLLMTSVVTRKVLKIPRCSICSELHKRSSVTPRRFSTSQPSR